MSARTLEIEPYAFIGSARFGMKEEDVLSAFGEIRQKTQNQWGEVVLWFDSFMATVGGRGLVEVGMWPQIKVVLAGTDIFTSRGALGRLCRLDGDPQHTVGFVVLKKLGIALTGFHDGDEDQKAVTAFARGRWDEFDLERFDQKFWH